MINTRWATTIGQWLVTFVFLLCINNVKAQDKLEYKIDTPLVWVDDIQYSTSPLDNDHIGGLAYRLLDRQTRFQNKQKERFRHYVMEVTNQSGLSDAAKIQVDFDPQYQQLYLHQAHIIRNDSIIDVLIPEDISVVRTETDLGSDLYYGQKTALLVVNDLRVGDVLEYSYTLTGSNPIFFGGIFDTYSMQWSAPILKNHLSITVPNDVNTELKTVVVDKPTKTEQLADSTKYTWLIENQTALETYSDAPSWYLPFARVEITEYQEWADVVDWAMHLYHKEHTSNEELNTLLNDIQKNNTDIEKASSALAYVQDSIRYYGIELGVNSHQPSQPQEVLNRKYGDCKDKAVLLVHLLNQMNIEAYPALVSTIMQRNITERLPSPGIFNHVIVKAILDGESYWIDPTLSFQSSQLFTASELSYEYALVIAPDTKHLEPIISKQNSRDKINIVETFSIAKDIDQADQLIVATSNEGFFSDVQRASLAYNNSQELAKHSEGFYSNLYPGQIESAEYEFNDDRASNLFTSNEEYNLERYWEVIGRYERLQTYAHTISGYATLPSETKREWPIAIQYPLDLKHKILISGPYNEDYVEAGFEQISTKHLTYNRTIDINDEGVSIAHQFYTNTDVVAVDELEEYYEAVRKIKKLLQFIVVRDHAKEDVIKERENRIQSLLRKKLEN